MRLKTFSLASREQGIRAKQRDGTNGKNISNPWQSRGYGTLYGKNPK